MRTTLLILFIGISLNSFAQNPILPLDSLGFRNTQNAYYKDLNNELNPFEGVWLYTNGNTTLKIILEKKLMAFNGSFYEDMIIGEYQYIENGIEKMNTLNDLNNPIISGYDHNINGSTIYNDCEFLPSEDCIDGEKRLSVGFIDTITPHWANVLLHKRVINNQDALIAIIVFNGRKSRNPDVAPLPPSPTMPWQGEYTLIKQ